MPPYIAASIVGLFIVSVFIIDSKRKPNVSYSHWIPFVWFLIVSSRPVAQWFYSASDAVSDASEVGSSPIDATVLTILIILGLFILSKRWGKCSQVLTNNIWLILLVLYCFISISWSDYPSVSFKRWVRGLGTLIMVLVVMTEVCPFETVRTMIRRSAFLTVSLSILVIRYFREIGVYYESWGARGFAGVTTGKNPLGRLCMILGTYFAWEIFTNWKNKNHKSITLYRSELFVNITFVIMILWLLRKADSATSLGCLIIGIGVLLLLSYSSIRKNITFITVALVLVVIIILLLDLDSDFLGIFTKSMDRDLTLTGRTEIWKLCLKFVENPLIGVGYDSFWLGERLDLFWGKVEGHPVQAHNGYIDVYIQIGIIGLFAIAAVMISIYNRIRKTLVNDFELGSIQCIVFIQYLIYNIPEDAFKLHSLYWFSFLLIELIVRNGVQPEVLENQQVNVI